MSLVDNEVVSWLLPLGAMVENPEMSWNTKMEIFIKKWNTNDQMLEFLLSVNNELTLGEKDLEIKILKLLL